MSLYDEFKAAGCRIGSHESDMYVRADDTARAITKAAFHEKRLAHWPTLFRSEAPDDNGALFYEFPFGYSPWWRERGMQS